MKVIQFSKLTLVPAPTMRLADWPLYYEPVSETKLNKWARVFKKGRV